MCYAAFCAILGYVSLAIVSISVVCYFFLLSSYIQIYIYCVCVLCAILAFYHECFAHTHHFWFFSSSSLTFFFLSFCCFWFWLVLLFAVSLLNFVYFISSFIDKWTDPHAHTYAIYMLRMGFWRLIIALLCIWFLCEFLSLFRSFIAVVDFVFFSFCVISSFLSVLFCLSFSFIRFALQWAAQLCCMCFDSHSVCLSLWLRMLSVAYIFGVTTLTVQPNVYIIRTFNRSLPFLGILLSLFSSLSICSACCFSFGSHVSACVPPNAPLFRFSVSRQVANPNESESLEQSKCPKKKMKADSFIRFSVFACWQTVFPLLLGILYLYSICALWAYVCGSLCMAASIFSPYIHVLFWFHMVSGLFSRFQFVSVHDSRSPCG